MESSNDYNDTTDYNELFLAVHNGDLSLVQSLLEKDSSTETICGRTLLHVATAKGHATIAKLFTIKRDGAGNTPLHLAIRENRPELFSLLLEDSNLNARNLEEERPLHFAALYDRPEFAKILLDNDATVEVKNKEGITPLYIALEKGNVRMAEILFKHGAVISDDNLKDMDPLRLAVKRQNFEMVKLLMANGCNKVDVPPKYSSLNIAVSSGDLDILEYLIKNGVKNRETFKNDKLQLFQSLFFDGSLDTLKFLVDIGIKVHNIDDVFNSIVYLNRHDMWKYLITRLSKINAKTYFKEKQLHFSIRMGELETLRVIVSEPSNEYKSNTFARKLAVYIAVESGSEEILKILLDAGYPVDSLFKCISPLHLAATFEHPRLVKLLLKAGADVNLQTEDRGRTPLHFATTAAQPAVVKYLLNNGADPSKTSKCGDSPLKEALEIHAGSYYPIPVTSVVFEGLVEITEMFIQYSDSETNENLFSSAVETRISSSINNSKLHSRKLMSSVGDSVFRPEILRCICNYLSDKTIQSCIETVLVEESSSSLYPPELLHLLIEYDNSKSCFDVEINSSDRNSKSQLLLIGYSKNVNNLEYVINEISDNYDEEEDDEVEKKNKTDFLKLLVCRLVLLNINRDRIQLDEECELIDLIDWRDKCLKEKRVMQKTKVNKNLNFTFYHVLTKSIDKVAKYTSNNDFVKAIESSEAKFPIYADFLKTSVEVAERRRASINDCVNLMLNLVQKYHRIRISRVEINQIFKYLSIFDLRRFSAACS